MEMFSFIQNLGLLPLVSNVPKINPTLWNFQGNLMTIDQDIDQSMQFYLQHKIIDLVWSSQKN